MHQPASPIDRPPPGGAASAAIVAAGAAIGVLAWLAFANWTDAIPSWLRAALAGLLFTFGPGAAIAAGLLVRVPLLPRIALALGVGLAVAPVLAEGLAAAGLVAAYPGLAAGLAGAVAAFWALPRPAPLRPRSALLAPLVVVAIALGIGAVAFAARMDMTGGRTTITGEYDTYDLTYYAAIAGELTHTMPPASPFFAGRPLNHSYYPHVVPALVHRFAGVSLLDLYFRFAWPACLALAALLCFYLVEEIASRRAAILAALLLVVGSDLSYLASWLFRPTTGWDEVLWSTNLLSPGAETLLFNNWTPTLAVVFASLYAIALAERQDRVGWLLVAGGSVAMTVLFKPFAFGLVLAGLGGAFLCSFGDRPAQRRFVVVAATALLLALPLLYRVVVQFEDTQVTFAPALFTLPLKMLERLQFEGALAGWFGGIGISESWLPVLMGLAGTPLFLVGGLGYRLAGAGVLWRCLRHPTAERPIWRVLAWGVVAGIALPFVFTSVPYHETMQVQQFSMFVLPAFVGRALAEMRRPRAALVTAAAVVALAVPSTLHYLQRKVTDGSRPFAMVTRAELPAIRLLQAADPATTVVLHNRPSQATLVGILSARRSLLSWSRYVRDSDERRNDVDAFFRSAGGSPERALATLERYRPTHVLEYRLADAIHPDVIARLDVLVQNNEITLYAVPDGGAGPATVPARPPGR